MKTRITLVLTVMFLGLGLGYAQQNPECMTKLSIFHEYVKAENYDAAYEPWMFVRETCPKFNRAIIVDGEKILEHKIEKSAGAEKVKYINDLMKLYDEALVNFSTNYETGEVLADKAQLMYSYKTELGKSDLQVYDAFDQAYIKDKENFTSAKGLYIYFKLMVGLFDAGKKPAEDLFKKYDEVVAKIEQEIEKSSKKLNEYVEKEEAGTLTSKDQKYQKYYGQMLEAYDKVMGSVNSELGTRADCANLVPLFNKQFEENKTNADWLQRAAGLMSEKECTEDPLFFKLVNAYHDLSPSANSAYYLGLLKDKEGKSNEALKYYEQALSLETDGFKKAKLYNKIALKLKSKGNYSKARSYFREALALNPSNGRPHLAIAAMYAASANSCGTDNFSKRAVFWLAADEARKAGRVDPTLKSAAAQSATSYEAKAPSKSDIFSKGNAGQSITIGCWIGASVTVPSI